MAIARSLDDLRTQGVSNRGAQNLGRPNLIHLHFLWYQMELSALHGIPVLVKDSIATDSKLGTLIDCRGNLQ